MTCSRCGAPLPRPDIRFCTACGAPTGQQAGPGPNQPGGQYPQPGQPQYPGGQPPYPGGQYPPASPGYGQPPYDQPPGYSPGPYGQPPGAPPPRSGTSLAPLLIGAFVILLLLGGAAAFFLSQTEDSPLALGRAEPTRTPTPTVAPTATRQPGIGINIPGPGGTPTQVTIPLPIPGLGASGTPGASPQLPIPIPGISGPGAGALPGASGTPPPSAKLTADGARQKVKDTITNCRLLQTQVEASQVTFEAPNWTVRLPLTGASWTVNDDTGQVTPDERAAERARTCRL